MVSSMMSFVSVTEAADLIGVTDSYVRRLLREKELVGQKVGARAWVIPMEEVKRFKDEPRNPGPPRISEKVTSSS